VDQCENDADTSIVRQVLSAAADGSVEVRAEDADVLVMLVHHRLTAQAQIILSSLPRRKAPKMLERSEKLSLKEKGHGKTTLFDRFCEGGIDEYMNTFLDRQSNKDAVIKAGVAIFQYIYHAAGATLGTTCSLRRQRLG